MQYLGIDWGTRRASWCAIDQSGSLREGSIPAEQDGLCRLALTLGAGQVRGCIEMMSGAVWVRDQLATVGWDIRLADARKVKAIAPLACKTECAARRPVVSPAQPGGTRREVLGSNGSPGSERRTGQQHARKAAVRP